MPTPARLANFVLLLCLLALAGYAYWEHQMRISATEALAALDKERNDLRKRLWSAGTNRRGNGTTSASTERSPFGDQAPPADGAMGRGGPERFLATLNNPEAQRLLATQQRAALDARYGALFRALKLSPEQLEKLKSLLIERQTTALDVFEAARTQGLNSRDDREQIATLVTSAQAEVDQTIREAIGETAYAQYQNYEQTLPQRTTVSQVESRLSYSATPLSSDQTEQLVQIMAATTASASTQSRLLGPFASGATITDATLTQSQSILSAAQLQALQQIQEEQQAQAKLRQLFRPPAGAGTPPRN